MCLQGAARVAAALTGIAPDAVRTYVVWVPMLPPDSEAAARDAALTLPGAAHFWDGDRRLAAEVAQALGITARESLGVDGGAGIAWDVYLAHGRGDGDIRQPRFWMHQLAVKATPRLDPDEFRRRVERLLWP